MKALTDNNNHAKCPTYILHKCDKIQFSLQVESPNFDYEQIQSINISFNVVDHDLSERSYVFNMTLVVEDVNELPYNDSFAGMLNKVLTVSLLYSIKS